MERSNRPRLRMKFHGRREDSIPSLRRTPERLQRIVYRPPLRQCTQRKRGATGLGFRLNATVCPKLDQIFLAFSTILLILSLDLLVLTVLNVGPGMLSRNFSPATCKIVEKRSNVTSYCYVTSLNNNHGNVLRFPCLQVFVTIDTDNVNNDPAPQISTSAVTSSTEGTVVPPTGVVNHESKKLLLYQNELHLVGEDYINRPCSFLPSYCAGSARDMQWQVLNYSEAMGGVDASIQCHYTASNLGLYITSDGIAMRYRTVTIPRMVHAIFWPMLGVVVSVLSCAIFWKKNRHRVQRLFIYNAWAPS